MFETFSARVEIQNTYRTYHVYLQISKMADNLIFPIKICHKIRQMLKFCNRLLYMVLASQNVLLWIPFKICNTKYFRVFSWLHCKDHLKSHYNIAFVNSERWLAKSRVDITLCQHRKFPATLLWKFFVLYYKRNIKHFFRIDIQLYQHSWKLEKLEMVWKHSALRASCFQTISRFSNFHLYWYNCISTRKMFYIS